MLVTAGGRRVMINGKMQSLVANQELAFVVSGTHFPYSNYEPPDSNVNAYAASSFRVNFKEPSDTIINYGDGVVITYPSVNNQLTLLPNSLGNYPKHTYQDSDSGKRVITIRFSKPSNVITMTFNYTNIYDAFPSNITALTSLQSIGITQSILTSFPEALSSLINLNTLRLNSIGTAISQRIPDSFLNLNLKTLHIAGSVNLSDVYASNFYNLCNSVSIITNLQSLYIDRAMMSEFPPNISNLTSLTDLRIGSGDYVTVPYRVNEIIGLKTLSVGGGLSNHIHLVNQTYIGDLVNLTDYYAYSAFNMETILPAGLENCVLLKNYDVGGSFLTSTRIDSFISNLYSFIEVNASKMAGNTKFRQIHITTIRFGSGGNPSGTYQQPAGFILGVSNGTPASPLEKIWVMVNQYQHTWTY